MDRLTDPSQGYCEKYCENFGVPGCSPESCAMKHEVEMYEVLKQLEGIVSFDRLIELTAADRDGEIIILPQTSHEKLLSDITKMVPLTLEQLREMVGQWVWVVVNYDHDGELYQCDGWALIPTPAIVSYLDQTIPIDFYGKKFVAYAYPPSYIDREALCGEWQGEADGYADGELVYDVWRCGGCGHVEERDDPDLLPRFCPECGCAMTPEAWAELERRIMGKNMTDGEL